MKHLKNFENFNESDNENLNVDEAKEQPYTCNIDKGIVYSGKRVIAMVAVSTSTGGRTHVLKVLQGVSTDKIMDKLLKDCPEFCKEYNFDEKYYPTGRLSEETAKKYNKK